MTTVDTSHAFDHAYVTSYSQKGNEPSWLLDFRLQALQQIYALPFPKVEKTRIDNWNVDQFNHEIDAQKSLSDRQFPPDIRRLIGSVNDVGNILVHKNAGCAFRSVKSDLAKRGVIFTDMHTAILDHPELVRPYLMTRLYQQGAHKISAVHAALFNCGIFVYVPKNVQVELPLQSIFWQDQANIGVIPHVLIVAEQHSKITYVENTLDTNSQQRVVNYAAEVFVGAGAEVTFIGIDHLGEQTTSYIYRQAEVDNDGRVEWAIGQLNDGNTVSDNTTYLKGNGAYGDSKSIALGRGVQSQNFVQRMVQSGLSTDAHMLTHGVMKDESRAIFNGITKIEKGSTKSNGVQTARVLMLSERARGDANPILLIDEDDVTAGHAASVGKVDEFHLYYLMSRGVSRKEAERLIILGFLNPVVQHIPLQSMKEQMIEVIEGKVMNG